MTITSHIDIFAEILNSSFFTMKQSEIKKKYPYVERDISWMYFNQRILLEAARPEVPLLERLTFLGIYSNNLDEFFRVRVATLNRIVEYADKNIQAEQETAACTLKQIGKLHNRYYKQLGDIRFHYGGIEEREYLRHQRCGNDGRTESIRHFFLSQQTEWFYQSAFPQWNPPAGRSDR